MDTATTSIRDDGKIDAARRLAQDSGEPCLDPALLYGRASSDDLDRYTAGMLAAGAVHAARELAAWRGGEPRITIGPVPGLDIGKTPVSVLSIVARNMPFLYDSVMAEVAAESRDIALAVHPILVAAGEGQYRLFTRATDRETETQISHIQIHLTGLDAARADGLAERLAHVLSQVDLACTGWKPMLALLDEAMTGLKAVDAGALSAERDEAVAFLDWLRNDNFTFLGMREYVYSREGGKGRLERGPKPGLGILSDPDVLVLRRGKEAVTTTPEILAFLEGPDFLIVTKANAKSVVHRRGYMDYVGVKRFDAQGNVIGELRITGLFTSTAYTRSVSQIPLLRRKVAGVAENFGFDGRSHSGRRLQNTLEAYPRDDLFQIDTGLLTTFCEQINDLAERPRVRVLPRIDRFDRFVSLIVYVPREDYNSAVREKIGQFMAAAYEGHVSAYYPAFPEGGVARVHIIVGRRGGKTPEIGQSRLEEAVRHIVTRWSVRLAALAGPDAPRLEVSQAYQESFAPEDAVADLPLITAALETGMPHIAFHYHYQPEGRVLGLKIFNPHRQIPLSRRVPLLENLGFSVISEQTFELDVARGDDGDVVILHDMELAPEANRDFDLKLLGPVLEDAFQGVYTDQIDNDPYNRLIITAGLTARETAVLRAYARYLRQTGIVYSPNHIAETLVRYPAISAAIFRLFHDSFDPAVSEQQRPQRLADHRDAIAEGLVAVPTLDEDRILRRYVNAIDATLRTNYFQRDAQGQPSAMLAFKFDPALVAELPEPRPFREIFVYGTEVEGVHLRFGKVARGGLRWSDRAQDYRTEVLGLVKAQQVKNAVIVPVGAKGGFYPKNLPANGSRDEIFAAGKEAYKTYIRTLLSITDNIDGGKVVPPDDTVRLDGDDPYFVVAADKGTATFSDTANELAQAAGFWLDDAFASGGSAGYDHKKMGITARGAWETVKRHFREKDIDIQTTPFTVAGVGDMSGDVFGNGMLLSEKIRLVAAFDHRDIFIDPDPDVAGSFAERRRMFDLPRSSWQDYDRSTLSKGAMIISRAEKSVTLTPEAMTAVGLDKAVVTPVELMTAILKAPVDLLWFGGIGTYVKAPEETSAEVGDRANDAIRVSATEVQAAVIGEGANLGVTQKGRIAFALKGGRVNSDAIDNSAGVNSSDVEVNIKIALATAMREGRLTRDARNRLLVSMTDEVAQLVLRNNYLQGLAISLTERQGVANSETLSRLMNALESRGHLNRKVENLPSETLFAERYAAGKPLTRPEIGVLLSYAKITLSDALVASDLPDDPWFARTLAGYFPERMQEVHADDIASHPLRREIIATVLANEVINRGGAAFVQTMSDATSASAADVVHAAVLVREGFELDRLWAGIDALDARIEGALQLELYATIQTLYTEATRVLLKTGLEKGDIGTAIGKIHAALHSLRPALASATPAAIAEEIAARRSGLVEAGVPPALAAEIAGLLMLALTPEIMQVAERTGATLLRAVETYFAISQTFRIPQLIRNGSRITATDHYEALALTHGLDQIAAARRHMVVTVLTSHANEPQPVEVWHASDRLRINRVAAELANLSDSGEISLARIAVAAGLLTDLAAQHAA
ncbi:NAD-glutamate dehydrogenase [Rhizobiaceae bacterium BDR2-2]|uniref:NAD-glutamate dehydrogenase n=1 Tax=Ectorhizobium quercum TaxID=2965071 RepID=A0AAE3N3I3_9HYPH|nr:NAD-glutamate dehydrogenase [Ectorhizobium quercum]MCX8999516.1 NAD-glutamate dehydrogenase [Ectorhizobium quercum]